MPGYYALVLDLLGPSIGELLTLAKGKFSFGVTAALGSQMVSLLEHIHSNRVTHQDVKPENFLASYDMKALYIIDFGLSKKYPVSHSLANCISSKAQGLIGTPRYASINAHYGNEQGMRDDLESLFYVLIYLMRGRLPWQRLKDKSNSIIEVKLSLSTEELCVGLPGNFLLVNR